MPIVVQRSGPDQAAAHDLLPLVETLGQVRWFTLDTDWHLSSHTLAAVDGRDVVGFLRFVVQEIGPDNDQPPVFLGEEALREAKVLAFGVAEEARNRGVGRKLQQGAIEWATELGCHQMRSHSGGESSANHALKLKMGFGVHPIIRGDDVHGVYFILPLRAAIGQEAGIVP